MKNPDTSIIQRKVFDMLQASGWADPLKTFILSSEFAEIIESLQEELNDGNRFIPKFIDVFNPFMLCSYQDVKVVIIADSPSSNFSTMSGIPFCFEPDILNTRKYLKEGILFMYKTPTTSITGRVHTKIWKPFFAFMMDTLINKKKDLYFIALSKSIFSSKTSSDIHTFSVMSGNNHEEIFKQLKNQFNL